MNLYHLFDMLLQEDSGSQFKMIFHALMFDHIISFLDRNSGEYSNLIQSYHIFHDLQHEIIILLNINFDAGNHQQLLHRVRVAYFLA